MRTREQIQQQLRYIHDLTIPKGLDRAIALVLEVALDCRDLLEKPPISAGDAAFVKLLRDRATGLRAEAPSCGYADEFRFAAATLENIALDVEQGRIGT